MKNVYKRGVLFIITCDKACDRIFLCNMNKCLTKIIYRMTKLPIKCFRGIYIASGRCSGQVHKKFICVFFFLFLASLHSYVAHQDSVLFDIIFYSIGVMLLHIIVQWFHGNFAIFFFKIQVRYIDTKRDMEKNNRKNVGKTLFPNIYAQKKKCPITISQATI